MGARALRGVDLARLKRPQDPADERPVPRSGPERPLRALTRRSRADKVTRLSWLKSANVIASLDTPAGSP
jgi:hypothetical protein